MLALSNVKPYVDRVNQRVMKHLMRQSDLGIMEGEGLLEKEMIEYDEESDDEEQEPKDKENSENNHKDEEE